MPFCNQLLNDSIGVEVNGIFGEYSLQLKDISSEMVLILGL